MSITVDQEYYFQDNEGNVRVTSITDHLIRGKCSGIPPCCVKYYIEVVLKNLASSPIENWGYRPCPKCVESGNRVTVKNCYDDNGADCICGAWANSKLVK